MLIAKTYKVLGMNFSVIAKQELKKVIVLTSGFTSIAALAKSSNLRNIKKVNSIPEVSKAIDDWIKGDLSTITNVKVVQTGPIFYANAWKQMRTIKPGKLISYTTLAKKSGNKLAVRAAGTACAQNKIALFVPCHRIIRSDGSIGNYAYSVTTKRKLLAHEIGPQISLKQALQK